MPKIITLWAIRVRPNNNGDPEFPANRFPFMVIAWNGTLPLDAAWAFAKSAQRAYDLKDKIDAWLTADFLDRLKQAAPSADPAAIYPWPWTVTDSVLRWADFMARRAHVTPAKFSFNPGEGA